MNVLTLLALGQLILGDSGLVAGRVYLLLMAQLNARHLFPPELVLYTDTLALPQPDIERLPFEPEG